MYFGSIYELSAVIIINTQQGVPLYSSLVKPFVVFVTPVSVGLN